MHIGAKALGIVFDKSHLTPIFMHYFYNVSYIVINGYIGHIWFNGDTGDSKYKDESCIFK